MCAVGSQRNCLIETVLWVPTAYVWVQMNDYINSSFVRILYLFGENKALEIVIGWKP